MTNKQKALAKLQLIVNIVDQLSRQGLRTCDEIDETVDQIYYTIEMYNPEVQSVVL